MISYDVTALFTSIPVEKAITVIEKRLQNDVTLNKRCELSIDQIMTLLSFCLNTTYFIYDGVYYKQKHGAAMGSSVSPVVVNLYMEDFEEKAIRTAPQPPHLWLRYVDDTFVVIHEYDVDSFTKHINTLDPDIKFTIEPEIGGKIPFLDTEIVLNDDASLTKRLYRKSTHTDQYLNWYSNHPLEHKRSVVRTLIQRANTIPSNEQGKKAETTHVKRALAANEYKSWIFKMPEKDKREIQPPSTTPRNKVTPVALPYIHGLSENLRRIFKNHNIPSYHKPVNTIRNQLVRPWDTTPIQSQCVVVYHIQCPECQLDYIGETGRNMGTRFKEHTNLKGSNLAIKEHLPYIPMIWPLP